MSPSESQRSDAESVATSSRSSPPDLRLESGDVERLGYKHGPGEPRSQVISAHGSSTEVAYALGRVLLQLYFSAVVARQSIDLDDARALWSELPLPDSDGPRRIPGHPASVMVGTK